MVKNLVSIITPCYGTANYLGNLLESVLAQDYPHIEMFVIDDGSPDNIKQVVDGFKTLFENRGISLNYIYQENSGQSVAIKNGLELVSGEYLLWPDSDDYYSSPEAISKMVERFKQCDSTIGIVRCQEILVADDSSHTVINIIGEDGKELEDQSLFNDCLFVENGFYFPPGGYMMKLDAFMSSVKSTIYTERDAGQNWQLVLPVLYNYRCSTIREPLFSVVERSQSHSRNALDYNRFISRQNTMRKTIIHTLRNTRNMSEAERRKYEIKINDKYDNIIFYEAVKYDSKGDALRYFPKLQQKGLISCIKYYFKYLIILAGLQKVLRRRYFS